MPKISVIMGVYNFNIEVVLKNSIESVLNQTFQDFEFIICDDGSTDGTYQILERICNGVDKIKLIRNEKNLGLAASLNKCIEISKGEYIARQDADDYSLPDRFDKQIRFLENNKNIFFVGCNINYYNENGIWGNLGFKYLPQKKDFLFLIPFMHPTIIFRKNCLLKVGGYKVSKITQRAEDLDLFMRLYHNGYHGANIESFLYNYLENNNSIKKRKFKYRIYEVIVRYNGFKQLGLLPKGYIYIFKPVIVGLIPSKILEKLKDIVLKRRGLKIK